MMNATIKDKDVIIDILSASFLDNKSVNYIIRQNAGHTRRLRNLMEYSFEMCLEFGKIFISNDRKCCALVLLPDRKKLSFKSLLRDLKLVFRVTGLGSLLKAIKRESMIKERHPADREFYYIWFVGVSPLAQGRGAGTLMMKKLLSDAKEMHRSVYLETSTVKNIYWYKSLGFQHYDELSLGYKLYFFRKNLR